MSLHSLRLVKPDPMLEALTRLHETLKAGIEADKTPLEDINIRLEPDGSVLVLAEDLVLAYEWGNYLKLPWTVLPNGISWRGTHNGLSWLLRAIKDEPEKSTNWGSGVHETGTFEAVSS